MIQRLFTSISAVALLCTTASVTAFAGDGHRGKHVFKDYARVLHVEPKFRIVTKRTPQRTCDVPNRHYHQSYQSSYNNHRPNNNHRPAHQHRPHNPGAVFIGGVIGGAIGHELTRSVNGKTNPGAVITGAAIGAGLVANHQQQRRHRPQQTHASSHQYDKPHRRHRRPHCSTTYHIQEIRQPDGYLVTYRFRGETFRTHTDYHPGDRIPVRVAISTGH